MVDSNLIRYFAGEKMPSNKHTQAYYRQFIGLVMLGRDLRICLPQRVELATHHSAYERAIKKELQNQTDEEKLLISAIEFISHEDKESIITESDIPEIMDDQRRFGFGSALGDLLISYLARRNGWSLITAEGENKPMQKYIRHYGLEP